MQPCKLLLLLDAITTFAIMRHFYADILTYLRSVTAHLIRGLKYDSATLSYDSLQSRTCRLYRDSR